MDLTKPMVDKAAEGSLEGAIGALNEVKEEVAKVISYWANVEDE